MAEKITVNSRVHTKWNRSETDSNNINNAISDIGQIDLTASYVTGVGPFQTEELFHDVRNLTVNQIYTYDLSD